MLVQDVVLTRGKLGGHSCPGKNRVRAVQAPVELSAVAAAEVANLRSVLRYHSCVLRYVDISSGEGWEE